MMAYGFLTHPQGKQVTGWLIRTHFLGTSENVVLTVKDLKFSGAHRQEIIRAANLK